MTTDSDYESSSCTYSSESYYYPSSTPSTRRNRALLALGRQLDKEISPDVHYDVDLAVFAREVWGLDEGVINKLLAMFVALDEAKLANYKQCTEQKDHHKLFRGIAGQLLEASFDVLGEEPSDTFTDSFWDRLAQNPSQYVGPDMMNSLEPLPGNGTRPGLSLAKSLIAFKLTPETEDDSDDDVEQSSASETPGLPTDQGSTTAKSSCALPLFKRPRDGEGNNGPTGKKRCLAHDQPLQGNPLPVYAAEAMAASCRHYVVGMAIDSCDVTVCYFDRFLVACVATFSFAHDPSKLALALYAMTRCDHLQAGFNPRLRPAPSPDEGDAKRKPGLDDIVGFFFEYPTSAAPEKNDDNSAHNTDSQPDIPLHLGVTGVIARAEGVIGRATSVYKVKKHIPDGSLSNEVYALKISWPPIVGNSEIDVIQTLKDRLPEEAHVHLPDLFFTASFTLEDLNLPSIRLSPDISGQKDFLPVQRVMAGKMYHKLWEAGSIENFKRAWIDCVECLYLAGKLGKVLHRDISENNLMIQFTEEKVTGVLNDWDLGWFVDQPLSTPAKPIGTPPFMATDIMKSSYVQHYFRHDLESFFFVLIWAALHYNLEERSRDKAVHPSVAQWTRATDDNWMHKDILFTLEDLVVVPIYAGVKPDFTDLVRDWIKPLRKLFMDARCYHGRRREANEERDDSTFSGAVTFKSFMATIKVTPRDWGIPGFLDGDEF